MAGSYVWWFTPWRAEIYMIRTWFLESLGFGALETGIKEKDDRKALWSE